MPQRAWVEKRKRRHAENPNCHWCGIETVLVEGHSKETIRNKATLDHMDDRFDPMRGKRGGERRVVLACWDCNHRRGRERQAELLDVQRAKTIIGGVAKQMRRVQWPPVVTATDTQ